MFETQIADTSQADKVIHKGITSHIMYEIQHKPTSQETDEIHQNITRYITNWNP